MNALHNAGFLLIVVTNQPDVARGTLSIIEVDKVNDHLKRVLPIDEIRVCYHDDVDMCHCRKPLPGLLLDAAETHGIDLTISYMIGDRWRDIEAGLSAGCKTLFIDYGYPEKQPEHADHHVDSLSTAATIILRT
jgi:D-glycero-D-manno-heptose 1,7-bisphosphate phosphatase